MKLKARHEFGMVRHDVPMSVGDTECRENFKRLALQPEVDDFLSATTDGSRTGREVQND